MFVKLTFVRSNIVINIEKEAIIYLNFTKNNFTKN